MLINLYCLGTFKNNEEEMAVHEWLQKQESDEYQNGIFKRVPRWKQIHQRACGLCVKIMTLQ
jgi:hypothetical protein